VSTGHAIRVALVGAAAIILIWGIFPAPQLAGCSSREPTLPPPDQVYTARGRIMSLPRADQPLSELMILHEPIPAFVNKDGKVVGMDSMEMPFTPAKSVSLKGLGVGDVVDFTFEVRWNARPSSLLIRISRLPAGTELKLGTASSGQ
jgi:hypothetical protein